MARKGSSTIVQEELYPPSAQPAREELDDARLIDLDVDEESPFLRGQKRVSARRSTLPKKTANRLVWGVVIAGIVFAGGLVVAATYHYGERSWRFRVESSDNIDITGTQNVTKSQIMEVMGADIGRNIFFIPLAQQKAQLEQIPWVESASVMRFVPNRLKVEIQERTPVAFARVGPRISLVDAGGTLMELSSKHKYSFPVILGMNPGEPLSTRAPRMKQYGELVQDLDSGGARYSQDLSEVDLTDLDDVKVRVNDAAGDVLVHLGSSDYLRRYKIYVTHAQEWRQQFQKLESVDLRYDNQIIVNPDLPQQAHRAVLNPASAKVAAAAGVKPAALVTRIAPHMVPHDKAVPKPAFELTEKKINPNAAAAKAPAKKPVKHVARAPKGTAAKPLSSRRARRPPDSRPDGAAAAQKNNASSKTPTPAKPAAAKGIPKPSPAIAKSQPAPGTAQ